MSKLVIVESPAKAKTIGKMLGKDYIIKASYGHIRDLPERVFGVDIKNGFTPLYEESKARGKNITDLKQTAKKVDEIYLAPDPDREGEAIAWHLYEVLAKANKKAKFHRVAFHEITKNAISKAFQSPGEIDMDRVDAQQARRVLDRIVGYMVSPLLWTRIERGISAGRVQSVALRIVCEREREILAFVPKEYWNFNAIFNSSTAGNYAAKLFRINGDKFEVNAKTDADVIASDVCAVQNWKVADIDTQPRRRYAPPPFITSTLQQAASSALGFSASSTMRIAQQLYEGIDIGVGTAGLITYMRTDAVNIADEARNACREFIRFQYGDQYVPAKPNFFKSKSTAQAAHEAIRPTDVNRTPESLKEYLDPKQYKLYKLIWQRFVACQMAPAEQLRTTVTTEGSAKSLYEFRSTATVTTFPGFLRMYNIQEEGVAQEEDGDNPEVLGKLKKGYLCTLADLLAEQKFTEPPPRFSEATLIKELESNGIGRPSTYATIVNTIQEREYVNKEKGKLIPTELGFKVNDYLVRALPVLMETGFTADMETKLDQVEEGAVQWTSMMQEFYDQFSGWLDEAKQEGAPESSKVASLVEYLSGIRQWDAPEKRGNRTYDDKKFFTSIQKQQKALSGKQWDALMAFLVKYADQLGDIESFCAANGILEDLQKVQEKSEEIQAKRAAAEARKEAAANNPPPQIQVDLIAALDKVEFNPPEKRGARVYDDKKFFTSLKDQLNAGRTLSEKQMAALVKLAARYSGSIPGFAELASEAGISAAPAGQPAAEPAGAPSDADILLREMSRITAWAEPVKRGRRVYDDKEFFDSLMKQKKAGKVLSIKQVEALRKLAAKYGVRA
ncbi:MAG: type I DNA topoisomerase [Lentisphaeria bacterium]|nr:type I DNA topoisomerase [Lentisphaeria bacterium]